MRTRDAQTARECMHNPPTSVQEYIDESLQIIMRTAAVVGTWVLAPSVFACATVFVYMCIDPKD